MIEQFPPTGTPHSEKPEETTAGFENVPDKFHINATFLSLSDLLTAAKDGNETKTQHAATRIYNVIMWSGIHDIREIYYIPTSKLAKLKGISEKSAGMLKKALVNYAEKRNLSMDIPPERKRKLMKSYNFTEKD